MLHRVRILTILGLVAGFSSSFAFAQEEVKPAVSIVDQVNVGLINHLHQREWVQLDARGQLTGQLGVLDVSGRFVSKSDVQISLTKDDKVVQEIVTGPDGKFSITGLETGTYAFTSRSSGTFAAYALHVLPHNSSGKLSSHMEVVASVVGDKQAEEIVRSHVVPADIGAVAYYRSFQKDPLAEKREFSDSPAIALREDGKLVGRVSKPGWQFSEQDLTGNVAHILQRGNLVAHVPVSRDGYFEVPNFKPGVYDLIVAGDDGVAALGFEAVSMEQKLAERNSKKRFVALQGAAPVDTLCCEMVEQPCCGGGEMIGETVVGAPIGGGFVGGGGGLGGGGLGGGGGGLGGIGGLGGLLGIAGLAVGVAALADDDDANNLPVTPVVR